MILLQVNQLTKTIGADLILSNIQLEVQSQDRIGLVGRNGAGKSTLLKVIAGAMSYDSGEIIKPKNIDIDYLAQGIDIDSDVSIWEEMLTVFAPVIQMEKKLRTLEEKMSTPKLTEQTDTYEKLLKDYDELQIAFKNAGGYTYEADIRAVLHGLNFADFDDSTLISTLSGGQKTRLSLGKLLLKKPDLLILDEPTNHLDIDTLTWLENYLQSYPGALLIVSHDRYFLDNVVNHIYEISRQRSSKFHGNYSEYLREKAQRFDQDMKAYDKQQKEVAQLNDFIRRNIARASTTKRAQSRRKQLEKIDLLDKPKGDEASANFSFTIERQSGKEVLNVTDLSVGHHDQPTIEHLNFNITRGEKVALVGRNGIGKTTLLKTLSKKLTPLSGEIRYGSKVSVGYYDQEQLTLSSKKTVLDELWDEFPLTPEKEIRTVLGNFLFSGDDVLKPVPSLSGGEKARLALSKLMMQKANLLILDEPTNHLDLDSKEVLEAALADYPGTTLFVSHDRYFINRNTTRLLELTADGLTNYLGNYDDYLAKKEEQIEREKLAAQPKVEEYGKKEAKQTFEQEKKAKNEEKRRLRRIVEIERDIEQLETTLDEKEQQLFDPEISADYKKAGELNEEINSDNKKLDALMEEWTVLQE